MITGLWENHKVRAVAAGAVKRKKKTQNKTKHMTTRVDWAYTRQELSGDNWLFTSYVKHCNGCGCHPGGSAGQDSKVILDVHEEEAEVFEDSSSKAHDDKGRCDHDPAVPPIRRSGSPGLHLQLLSRLLPCCTERSLCNNPPTWVGLMKINLSSAGMNSSCTSGPMVYTWVGAHNIGYFSLKKIWFSNSTASNEVINHFKKSFSNIRPTAQWKR